MNPRIMYIERKAGSLAGNAWIGLVTFSKSGKSIFYKDFEFRSLKGKGYKSNYIEINSEEEYWISGPRKDGADRLYSERVPIHIDEDIREDYWIDIRGIPENRTRNTA